MGVRGRAGEGDGSVGEEFDDDKDEAEVGRTEVSWPEEVRSGSSGICRIGAVCAA